MMSSQQRKEFMLLPAAVHESSVETHTWFLQGKGIFTGALRDSPMIDRKPSAWELETGIRLYSKKDRRRC